MQIHLLYEDREWKDKGQYYDFKSIINDLGLEVLFRTASREQVQQLQAVQKIFEADAFLESTIRKVMMVPLQTEAEIVYRQEILKDFLGNEVFLRELYEFAKETLASWDKLGREQNKKINSRDASVHLVTQVHILRLFIKQMHKLKELLREHQGQFASEGLLRFCDSVWAGYSDEMEEHMDRLMDDISFYVDKEVDETEWRGKKQPMKKARIVMQCEISQGLKLQSLKLQNVETLGKKYKKRKRTQTFTQKYLGAFASEPKVLLKEDLVLSDTMKLEYQIVSYLVSCCDSFMNECKDFFEQLGFQVGFYMAAFHLSKRMERHKIAFCYPRVGAQDTLCFRELKDIGMAIEQHTDPVGNEAEIVDKILLIVTGANQGGKSTFLRSIGIAQIMMQCGLFVAAEDYESGIYPALFTHFTRREDSEMNSGRLDEELGRMNQIVENLGEKSLVLLNESFATTTEKEGSVIAYGIIKALTERGVKVLTVTHLLSFARQIYEKPHEQAEFLSAQRLEDGTRTFKMIQHEPELTSFGLDLYEQMIERL